MQKGLFDEHFGKLFADSTEKELHAGSVSDEGGTTVESLGRNVAEGGFDAAGNPLDEVFGGTVLHCQHLVFDVFGRNGSPSEDGTASQIAAQIGVDSTHHVLSIQHLRSEFGDRMGSVNFRVT